MSLFHFYVTILLSKLCFTYNHFSFIIFWISYKGGTINVGISSTKAVVYSSIFILIFNFILTDLILS